ncbi:unnamed protein product [Dovyalis caffra]|uniref:Uncharacterized protein n=1 Tax=Dovyalis caffra TaxID=77055 RepID=A0AAV1SH58_9ROSI|nr:unnamed protein product [Dovyalis caffra]
MGQEEQPTKCCTSNGSGDGGISIGHISRSSRKQKQKKVPQRGLGVAQLEKIRLEEQQKKDRVSINLPSPPTSQTKPSNFSVPVPNYESRSSSIPYPPDLSSSNSMFRSQNIELINPNSTIPLANSVGWQSAVQGPKNVPKMWNSSDYNLEKENCGVDSGLAFRSSLNLHYESNPIWPLPSLMQRAQQHRQHSSSCSKVNASSGSSSSSLQNFQMEPPSNQSYYDNYTYNTPVWIEEEKMVGMKRPYPFSLDNPPASSFQYKCPTTSSFGNGGLYNFSFSSPDCREGSSCSSSIMEPTSKKDIKENWACNGDFLTLAPPATGLTSKNLKLKPSAYLAFHNFEPFDFDSLPYQGNVEDQFLQQPGSIVTNQQQTYYCFLPPSLMQIGQPAKTINNCTHGGEVGENIDLNLKL